MKKFDYRFMVMTGGIHRNFNPMIYLSDTAYKNLQELAELKHIKPEELLRDIIGTSTREIRVEWENDLISKARRHSTIYIPILYADENNQIRLEVATERQSSSFIANQTSFYSSSDFSIQKGEDIELTEVQALKMAEVPNPEATVEILTEKRKKINRQVFGVANRETTSLKPKEEIVTEQKGAPETDQATLLFPEFSAQLKELSEKRARFSKKLNDLIQNENKLRELIGLPERLQNEIKALLRQSEAAKEPLRSIIMKFDDQRLAADIALNTQVRSNRENSDRIVTAKNQLATVIQQAAWNFFQAELKKIETSSETSTKKEEQKATLAKNLEIWYGGLIHYNEETGAFTSAEELQKRFAGLSLEEINTIIVGLLKTIDVDTFGKSKQQKELIGVYNSAKFPFTLDVAKNTFAWGSEITSPAELLSVSKRKLSQVDTTYDPVLTEYSTLTVFNNNHAAFETNLAHYRALQEQFRLAEEKESKLRLAALEAGHNLYLEISKNNKNLGLTKNGQKIDPKKLGATGLNEEETLAKELFDLKVKYRDKFNALTKGALASNLENNKTYAFVYAENGEVNQKQLTTLEAKVTNMKLEDAEGLKLQGLELAKEFQKEVDLAKQKYREALQKKAEEAYPIAMQQNFAAALGFIRAILADIDAQKKELDADEEALNYKEELTDFRKDVEQVETSLTGLSRLKDQMALDTLTPKEYQDTLKKLQEESRNLSRVITPYASLSRALEIYEQKRKPHIVRAAIRRKQQSAQRLQSSEESERSVIDFIGSYQPKPIPKAGRLRRLWNWAKENPFKAGLIFGLVGGLLIAGAGAAIFFSGGLAAIPLGGAIAAGLAPYVGYLAAHITVAGAAAVTMAATGVAGGIVGGVIAKGVQGIKRFGSWAMKRIRGSKKDRDLEAAPEEQQSLLRDDSLENERKRLNANFEQASRPTEQIEEDKTIENLKKQLGEIKSNWKDVEPSTTLESSSQVLDMPMNSRLNQEAQQDDFTIDNIDQMMRDIDSLQGFGTTTFTGENHSQHFQNPQLLFAKALFAELNKRYQDDSLHATYSKEGINDSNYEEYLSALDGKLAQYPEVSDALKNIIPTNPLFKNEKLMQRYKKINEGICDILKESSKVTHGLTGSKE